MSGETVVAALHRGFPEPEPRPEMFLGLMIEEVRNCAENLSRSPAFTLSQQGENYVHQVEHCLVRVERVALRVQDDNGVGYSIGNPAKLSMLLPNHLTTLPSASNCGTTRMRNHRYPPSYRRMRVSSSPGLGASSKATIHERADPGHRGERPPSNPNLSPAPGWSGQCSRTSVCSDIPWIHQGSSSTRIFYADVTPCLNAP
jgi:hypothetical protein